MLIILSIRESRILMLSSGLSTSIGNRGADGKKSAIPIFIVIPIDYAFGDIFFFHLFISDYQDK